MRGLRRWAGYAALNRPLTILGVERRGFLLSATLGLAMWNATASLDYSRLTGRLLPDGMPRKQINNPP